MAKKKSTQESLARGNEQVQAQEQQEPALTQGEQIDNEAFMQDDLAAAPVAAPTPAPASDVNEPKSGVMLAEALLRLSVNEIHIDDTHNLRHYAPNMRAVEELAHNIIARGQIQPVGVRLIAQDNFNGDASASARISGKQYELLFGFQRVQAIRYANENLNQDLPVLARVLTASDEDAMLLNLDENLRRKDLSLMDVAYTIQRFRERGMNGKEIGERLGNKTPGYVYQVAKLTELRPHIQTLIHNGKLGMTQARSLNGLDESEQDKILKAIEKGELRTATATDEARKKVKKRDPRGRKASKVPSIKAATALFEELSEAPSKPAEGKKAEKESSERQWMRKVAAVVLKYLTGEMGAGAVGRMIERIS